MDELLIDVLVEEVEQWDKLVFWLGLDAFDEFLVIETDSFDKFPVLETGAFDELLVLETDAFDELLVLETDAINELLVLESGVEEEDEIYEGPPMFSLDLNS